MTTIAPPALSLDVRAFYESHGCIVAGKPTLSREGKEYACSCPACPGSTDRASFWESGRYCCVRGCHAHASSPYWFLRDIKGYSHQQSCEDLGLDPREAFSDSYSQKGHMLPLFLIRDESPNSKWQEQAQFFCHMAEKCLWSSKGESARSYLQSRGLNEAIIKAAHLGLCPDWYKENLEVWGLSPEQLGKDEDPMIKIPCGIVIPWQVDGQIWKIQLRRPVPGPDGKKYKEVIGSSEALYNSDSFQPGRPVLLVESELDALSAMQEASDLVACIATGSTSKALTGRWIGRLKQASQVLQCFDNDEAGEAGAAAWIRVLSKEKASRWTPWAHDVNDMLQAGDPIRLWIELGLQTPEPGEEKAALFEQVAQQEAVQVLAHVPPALFDKLGKPVVPELAERVAAFQSRPCASCGGFDWFLENDRLLCPCIIAKREANLRLEEQAQPRQQDLEIEQAAIRIAEEEHLPLPQARYWARTRATLTASGYYEQVKRDQADLQKHMAAYQQRLGKRQ